MTDLGSSYGSTGPNAVNGSEREQDYFPACSIWVRCCGEGEKELCGWGLLLF